MENIEHNMDEMGAALTVKLWQGWQGRSRALFEQKAWDRNMLHVAGKEKFKRWCLPQSSQGSRGYLSVAGAVSLPGC